MDFSYYACFISLGLGIISVIFNSLHFKTSAAVSAVVCVLLGGYLACVVDFPISLLGGISVILGMMTIKDY